MVEEDLWTSFERYGKRWRILWRIVSISTFMLHSTVCRKFTCFFFSFSIHFGEIVKFSTPENPIFIYFLLSNFWKLHCTWKIFVISNFLHSQISYSFWSKYFEFIITFYFFFTKFHFSAFFILIFVVQFKKLAIFTAALFSLIFAFNFLHFHHYWVS